MPVYAYECRDCGVRFDYRQSFSDEPLTLCPECEGSVHRLIQPAGVIFKGSGFYSTDNRGSRKSTTSDGSTPEGKSAKSEKSETKSSETKSDSTKPAASTAASET